MRSKVTEDGHSTSEIISRTNQANVHFRAIKICLNVENYWNKNEKNLLKAYDPELGTARIRTKWEGFQGVAETESFPRILKNRRSIGKKRFLRNADENIRNGVIRVPDRTISYSFSWCMSTESTPRCIRPVFPEFKWGKDEKWKNPRGHGKIKNK